MYYSQSSERANHENVNKLGETGSERVNETRGNYPSARITFARSVDGQLPSACLLARSTIQRGIASSLAVLTFT